MHRSTENPSDGGLTFENLSDPIEIPSDYFGTTFDFHDKEALARAPAGVYRVSQLP